MSDQNRIDHFERDERFMEQRRLTCRRPTGTRRTIGVPETRPIEDDNAMPRGEPFDDSARHEIFRAHHIAMYEDDRRAATHFEIVHRDARDVDEASGRWVLAFGSAGRKRDERCGSTKTEDARGGDVS